MKSIHGMLKGAFYMIIRLAILKKVKKVGVRLAILEFQHR